MRIVLSVGLLVSLLCSGCAGSQKRADKLAAKARQMVTTASGTRIPNMGIAFAVSYDPATDTVVRGYRMLQVGISNKSLNIMELNPIGDRWFVVDRDGKKRQAILTLRNEAPDIWATLSPKLRQLIEYPLLVDVGGEVPVDLFFPESQQLSEFRQVIFESAMLQKTIVIYAREDSRF